MKSRISYCKSVSIFAGQHSIYKLTEKSCHGTLLYCLLDVFLLWRLEMTLPYAGQTTLQRRISFKLWVNGKRNCTSLGLVFGVVKCKIGNVTCFLCLSQGLAQYISNMSFKSSFLFMIYFKMCDIICSTGFECCCCCANIIHIVMELRLK